MKVVADTMMWVSYCTIEDGFRHRIIDRAHRQRVRFFVSDYLLQELAEALIEDLGLSKRYAQLACRAVLRLAKNVVLPGIVPSFVPADPEDDPIVQTALSAKVDYLVTADKEILHLRKVQDVEMITMQKFELLLNP